MKKYILGTGSHVYEAIHPFGTPPPGMEMRNASHVVTDSADRVHVYRRGDPPVLVFDGDGNFLSSWGDGLILDAHGIFVTPSDEIFLVDRDAHEILRFDGDRNVTARLGNGERPALGDPFNHPADLAVAANGEIFVADGYGNSRVHRFAPDGRLIMSWGTRGDGPGQLTTPHGIWVHDGKVYVCDRENNRVQIFTVDGEYVTEWGDFFHPMDIFRDPQGTFYVTDQVPRITMLDEDGTLISRGRTPFNGHGMWMDSHGNIYLASNADGVTKLAKV